MGACGHWNWTFDVPGRGLYAGAQSQVACPSPEMVCFKLFVPVFPHPGRKELVLEAWALCLCSQDVVLGWGACGEVGVDKSSYFQFGAGGLKGSPHEPACSQVLMMSLAFSCATALGSQPNEHY